MTHDDMLMRGGQILTDAERQQLCRDRRANGIVLASPVETTPELRQALRLLGVDTTDKKALAAAISSLLAALADVLLTSRQES